MGTKFAPVYAALTIGFLEELLYDKVIAVFGNDFGIYFQMNWKRFLHDCFIPWIKSSTDLEILRNILNNLHSDIRFTLQFSNTEQSFLDVLVKNKVGKPEIDIFYKETDSKQYLLFYSCHPRHTKTNISYNLARRLRTIISKQQVLEKRMEELKSFLIKQKYCKQIIDFGVEKQCHQIRNYCAR